MSKQPTNDGSRLPRRDILKTVVASTIGGSILAAESISAVSQAEGGSTWPQVSYDSANSSHAPNNWGPEKNIRERWSFNTGSYSTPTPVVANGRVFVTGDSYVYSISADGGNIHWENDLGSEALQLASKNGFVFVSTRDGFYALNASDGSEQWKYDNIRFSAPSLTENNIYLTDGGGNLISLSFDGTELWRKTVGSDLFWVKPSIKNGSIAITTDDNRTLNYSLENQSLRWEHHAQEVSARSGTLEKPVISDDSVYVSSWDTSSGSLGRLYSISSSSGTEEWMKEFDMVISSSPIVTEDSLFVGTTQALGESGASLYKLSAKTGEQEHQRSTVVSGQPVLADEVLFVPTRDGTTGYLSAFSRSDLTRLWRFRLGDGSPPGAPAVANGVVYAGDYGEGNIYAVEGEITNELPTATFDWTPDNPEVGQEISFDASSSNDSDGFIQSYEWDFDDDGAFEKTGELATNTFESPGNLPVTLQVTDNQGGIGTTTQNIPVLLDGSRAKLNLASKIDNRSVLNAIEERFGIELSGDKELAQETLNNLSQSVGEDEVSLPVANEALSRLQAIEEAALASIERLGPANSSLNMNLTRRISEMTINFAISITFIFVAAKTIAAITAATSTGFIGGAVKGIASAGLSLVESWLGQMFGSRVKSEAKKRCFKRADSLVGQVQNGAITTAEDLNQQISSAASEITELMSVYLRAVTDIVDIDTVSEIIDGTVSSSTPLFTAGDSIYGSLRRVDTAMQSEKIADGLQGETSVGTTAVNDGKQYLTHVYDKMDSFFRNIQAITNELDILTTLEQTISLLTEEEQANIQDYVTALAAIIAEVKDVIATAGATGGGVVNGYVSLMGVKLVHGELATAAIEGREVTITNVY